MTVLAIGMNHRSAPAVLLERVSFATDQLPKLLAEVTGSDVVSEAVALSTCNRTELYVHAERFHDGFRDVRRALGLLADIDPTELDAHLYVHYHQDAVRHLFRVSAGLDSVVLGEHEILGQVGRAWELARTETTTGPVLNLLFQRAVESGKRVRTETEIGRHTASLSHAAITLLTERRPDPDGMTVLLVGAGEVGADVARALSKEAELRLVVTNRTPARAAQLATELDGTTVPFDQLGSTLAGVDLVISATAAPEPVVSMAELETATAIGGELFVLDLAMPRDVPVSAAELPGVELCDLAAVQALANRGLEARRDHATAAEAVVETELERYRAASSAREVAPLIGDLHGWANTIRASEIERYASRLANMNDADREAVEALSRSIVAKILHQPTVSLKEAAGTARGDRLAEAVRELFDQVDRGQPAPSSRQEDQPPRHQDPPPA